MKLWSIIALLLVCISSKAQQTDSLLYERLLTEELKFWEAPNDSARFYALNEKSQIYFKNGNYLNALKELDRSKKYVLGFEAQYKYERILYSFMLGSYTPVIGADVSAGEMETIEKKKEFLIMYLIALNETERWKQCKDSLLKYATTTDTTILQAIRKLPETYNYKSTLTGSTLSGILPGLGQAYAGSIVKGTTSLLIHAALVSFIAYSAINGFYITAGVSGFLPLLKFYGGGKRYSAILAEERNHESAAALKQAYAKYILTAIP